MVTCQLSSECVHVHCVGIRWPKTTILGKFWHLGTFRKRGSVQKSPVPFTSEGQIWCARADPWHALTCQISPRLVYCVIIWRRKPPIFAVFWTSEFCGVTSWWHSQKVEHGCTITSLPLSNGIKIVSVLQCLHGEIRRTNSYVQKRDGQTKKTQRFWLPSAKWHPSPTKLGPVIKDLEHVLASLKLWGSDAVLPPGGCWKFRENQTPVLKIP